jgi:hypothetical protein
VEQLVLQTASGQILFQVEQRLDWLLSEFSVVDTRLHGDTSLNYPIYVPAAPRKSQAASAPRIAQ